MSSTGTYLRNLRKSELTEIAELCDLKDYADLKKAELEVALDRHLRAHSSIFSGEERLTEFYRRMSQPPRVSSPVKREPKSESSAITSSEEKKPAPRRRKSPEAHTEETEVEKTPASTAVATTARTPARSPLATFAASIPPSPAIITDAIDRQTTIARERMSDAWTKSGISERSDSLRAALSSVKSIETIIIVLELFSLLRELIPLRYLTTVPAVESVSTPEFSVKIPDFFVLITGSFWAPFSLWAMTSLILPLTVAYFFNLSLHAQSAPSHNTRRTSSAAQELASFDPLVYNIAKALVAYFVYANHFTFWSTFSHFAVERVNVSIPGQWPGIITGSAIGIIASLYEAVLRK